MPRFSAYEPVLSSKAAASIVGLSRAKQKQVLLLLFQLAEHPGQLGDYVSHDEGGRDVQHLMVGDWFFSFWADHAVRELRITEITEL